MIQRVGMALIALVLASACKTRDWDEGGILASTETESVVSGGDWHIACTEVESEAGAFYDIHVRGAVTRDETQPIVVSVAKKGVQSDTEGDLIVDGIPGRGAIDEGSSIFLGFHAGALTAEPEGDGRAYRGVLTLAESDDANAIDVRCIPTRS